MKILVTGGAGFIGSATCRHIVLNSNDTVINVDKLTYAGNLDSLKSISKNSQQYIFEQADIADQEEMARIFSVHEPDIVMNLAAESHVDRSIEGPSDFINTNIVGTYMMLEVARSYWAGLSGEGKRNFRFHHISTDEVFGSLGPEGKFTESTAYDPKSPYSASKASSDHLVRAWAHTFGLPIVISNTSNNYGPFQFPEKLIPLMILNALYGRPLPVYGAGENIRDWLYVEDHVEALCLIARRGRTGESYNVGGKCELKNIDVVKTICRILDEICPDSPHKPHEKLIEFVADRPGHDFRYAIDSTKVENELNWQPSVDFEEGLRKTVIWYLENKVWWRRIQSGAYRDRLGLGA